MRHSELQKFVMNMLTVSVNSGSPLMNLRITDRVVSRIGSPKETTGIAMADVVYFSSLTHHSRGTPIVCVKHGESPTRLTCSHHSLAQNQILSTHGKCSHPWLGETKCFQ